MAGPDLQQRRRRRSIAGAIFAGAVHLVVLGLLALSVPNLASRSADVRAISVDLVTPPLVAPERRPSLPQVAAPDRTPALTKSPRDLHGPDQPAAPSPTGLSPPMAAPATATPPEPTPPGLALRHTLIGCAFSGMVEMSEAELRHCHDLLAAGAKDGPDLSRFAVSPAKKAAFDAAADRENFLQKPILSQRPKNGCKPFVNHQQYANLGGSRDAYSVSFGCGKTF